ncbi:minor capsid protein [Hominenteromicrobium sp.]|uniref:minor capsid protein n=1 Tax=Hominenteromicrobium sp. TaxID=3073581 RepID=UPI003AB49180
MAYTGYINPEVAKMYGIPYSKLTAKQKRILHEDSLRRAKLIDEREKAVLEVGLKAFDDEAKMERVLGSIYKECQKSILADVQETIAEVQKAGGTWSYANQSALTRSRGLFEQITQELSKLGQKENTLFYQGLSSIYTDQYLRQMFTLGQFTEVKANLSRLNPTLIKKTLDYPWSGAMFSDRLWNDKERLGRNLRLGLTQSMVLGEGIPEITDRINKGIDTARYNAERVARSETKRVSYVAHDAVYEDTGVEELEYRCANGGDSRTCSLCRADNGKHYQRGKEPTLPRHPNCRCIYIPVVPDTFKAGELNELTGSVRGAENYEKWMKDNADKLNADGTLKEGWERDWKNGGKLVYKGNPVEKITPKDLNAMVKEDKDTLGRVDPMLLTDYPEPFYATKAEAKNTQAMMSYVNGLDGADEDVLSLYRSLDKAYNFDENGIPFKISHGKSHAVSYRYSLRDGKYSDVTLTIPKLSGDDLAGQMQTTLHEEMHLLDMLCGKSNREGGKKGAWVSSTSEGLVKAFSGADDTIGEKIQEIFKEHDKEVTTIATQMRKKLQDGIEELRAQYLPNGAFGAGSDYKGYKKAVSKLESAVEAERDYLSRNVMGGGIGNLEDIYDALSGGKHRDTGVVKYGHGSSYYRSMEDRRAETLANYGALSVLRPDLVELLAEDKPDLVEALAGAVTEMLGIVGGV